MSVIAPRLVLIGGSAGAIEAILDLFACLPLLPDAAVLVAIHQSPHHVSKIAELIARSGHPASLAIHGEVIAAGRVYVAPPDNHLEVGHGVLNVTRGPRENNHRPSIDLLFRSAAIHFESRVVAVLLSGYLDCGTAGLLSVKARRGQAIVQDPAEALAPAMPQSAIDHVPVDHVAPIAAMPALIVECLARMPAARGALHDDMPLGLLAAEGAVPGRPAPVVCPLCQGVLTESAVGSFDVFRCHVGHVFSLASLAEQQAESIEQALWAAVRALEEGSRFAGRLAAHHTGELRSRFDEKSRIQQQQADRIRLLLDEPHLMHQDR